MILHTINAGPSSSALGDCMAIAASSDAVLLLGDGVYAALKDTAACAQLQNCGAALYALQADAAAAGVLGLLAEGIKLIDMDGFVTLSETFPRQQAWY